MACKIYITLLYILFSLRSQSPRLEVVDVLPGVAGLLAELGLKSLYRLLRRRIPDTSTTERDTGRAKWLSAFNQSQMPKALSLPLPISLTPPLVIRCIDHTSSSFLNDTFFATALHELRLSALAHPTPAVPAVIAALAGALAPGLRHPCR